MMRTKRWLCAGLILAASLAAGMSSARAVAAANGEEAPVGTEQALVGNVPDPAQPTAEAPADSAPAAAEQAAVGVEAQLSDKPADQSGGEGLPAEPSDQLMGVEESCPAGGKCYVDACLPLSCHRTGVFAEGLYLHVGNADVVYAVEQTGCDPALASPTGRVGQITMDWEPGARAGFAVALSPCSSLVATYTWFESDSWSRIVADPGRVLASQVTHPSQANCGAAATWANAEQEINLQLADLDYRRLWCGDCDWAINWTAGLRYAHLTQRFEAEQNTANGLTDVTTDIGFDGFGIRLGLDGERRNPCNGLAIYGKTFASFVAGDMHADYRHTNQFGGTAVIGNTMQEWRVLTILEAELGLAWHSPCDHWRLSAGYNVAGIYDILTTQSYLENIRRGGVGEEDDLLTLTGLVARVEWRY